MLADVINLGKGAALLVYVDLPIVCVDKDGKKQKLPVLTGQIATPETMNTLEKIIKPLIGPDISIERTLSVYPGSWGFTLQYLGTEKSVVQTLNGAQLAAIYNEGGKEGLEAHIKVEVNNILNVYTG